MMRYKAERGDVYNLVHEAGDNAIDRICNNPLGDIRSRGFYVGQIVIWRTRSAKQID